MAALPPRTSALDSSFALCRGPKRSSSIVLGLMGGSATHEHNCFSLRLLGSNGALECLAVLNDVVLARKRWSGQSDHKKKDGEERGSHRLEPPHGSINGSDL